MAKDSGVSLSSRSKEKFQFSSLSILFAIELLGLGRPKRQGKKNEWQTHWKAASKTDFRDEMINSGENLKIQ